MNQTKMKSKELLMGRSHIDVVILRDSDTYFYVGNHDLTTNILIQLWKSIRIYWMGLD